MRAIFRISGNERQSVLQIVEQLASPLRRAQFENITNIETTLNRAHRATFEKAAKNLSKVAVKRAIFIGFSSYPKNVHPSIVRTEFMAQSEQKGTDL